MGLNKALNLLQRILNLGFKISNLIRHWHYKLLHVIIIEIRNLLC